jgi:hypothetical protein
MKMGREDFKKIITDLLLNQKLGVLATDLEGLPYTSLIAFSALEDLRKIIFSTLKDMRKFINMSRNPRVTLFKKIYKISRRIYSI